MKPIVLWLYLIRHLTSQTSVFLWHDGMCREKSKTSYVIANINHKSSVSVQNDFLMICVRKGKSGSLFRKTVKKSLTKTSRTAGRREFVHHSLDMQYPCLIQIFNRFLKSRRQSGRFPSRGYTRNKIRESRLDFPWVCHSTTI